MKIIGNYILRKTNDNDYILMPERSGNTGSTLCSLNSTGAFVWENLEKRKSLREISKLASKKYSIDRKTAEGDINAFLTYLSDIGIIEL